jgi:uncharacterized membrane protein YsdA (DUF1294 family)
LPSVLTKVALDWNNSKINGYLITYTIIAYWYIALLPGSPGTALAGKRWRGKFQRTCFLLKPSIDIIKTEN